MTNLEEQKKVVTTEEKEKIVKEFTKRIIKNSDLKCQAILSYCTDVYNKPVQTEKHRWVQNLAGQIINIILNFKDDTSTNKE